MNKIKSHETRIPRFLHVSYGRVIVTVALLAMVLMAFIIAISIFDQRRTDAEMGSVLSGFFANYALRDLQYWGEKREIQIIVLCEGQNAWKTNEFRGRLLFAGRSSFSQSASVTRDSFILSNVFPTNIRAQLVLPNRAQFFLISRKELEKLRQNGFQTKFPDNWGYFVISHVGLNSNKTEAILYIDHFCFGLCGNGSYYLMRKQNGSWRVVDQHVVWGS
jgi:hypothetical protein